MISLRGWFDADAAALRACVASSPDLITQLGRSDLDSMRACREFIRDTLYCSASVVNFAVCVDDVPRGNVGISTIEYVHATGWTHYWLARPARGNGYATRSLATIAQWAFCEQHLHRLELGHRTDNVASCGVALRAGFAVEGLQREKLRHGSRRYDVETHARLATDPAPDVPTVPLTEPAEPE